MTSSMMDQDFNFSHEGASLDQHQLARQPALSEISGPSQTDDYLSFQHAQHLRIHDEVSQSQEFTSSHE